MPCSAKIPAPARCARNWSGLTISNCRQKSKGRCATSSREISATTGDNWSPWSTPLTIDATGTLIRPVDLPSPREFFQFRFFFQGDAETTIRIDTLRLEHSPALVSKAVGEVALADDLSPQGGVIAVAGGVDTAFVYDIRADFDAEGLAGFRGIKLAAFPPPVFSGCRWAIHSLQSAMSRLRRLPMVLRCFSTPCKRPTISRCESPSTCGYSSTIRQSTRGCWARGEVPPHPIAVGDASSDVGTGTINIFTLDSRPKIETALSTPIVTPNGDAVNDAGRHRLRLGPICRGSRG